MASKDFDSMEDSNLSANPTIHQVSDPARRTVLRGGLGLLASAVYAPLVVGCAGMTGAKTGATVIGFKGIPAVATDTLVVPEGYIAEVIAGCRLVPRVAVAHLLRARVLRDRGKWAAARNAYERVLHIDPDDQEAIEGLRSLVALSES